MNTKTLKGVFAAVLLLLGMAGCKQIPVGISNTGIQSLRSEEADRNTFILQCPQGTASARANVEDLSRTVPALMRVMLIKNGNGAQEEDLPLATDDQPSDEGSGLSLKGGGADQARDSYPSTYGRPSGKGDGPSPDAELAMGAGTYVVMFFKTDEGQKDYKGSTVCQTASGPVTSVLRKIE
ncbi:MAG: hypothetical protein ACREXR_01035 [Gammaproteobacteria bacterium]